MLPCQHCKYELDMDIAFLAALLHKASDHFAMPTLYEMELPYYTGPQIMLPCQHCKYEMDIAFLAALLHRASDHVAMPTL